MKPPPGPTSATVSLPAVALPRHINNSGIPKRVPASIADECGTRATLRTIRVPLVPARSRWKVSDQTAFSYAAGETKFRDILEWHLHTIMVGRATPKRILSKTGREDYWYLGSPPKPDPCRCGRRVRRLPSPEVRNHNLAGSMQIVSSPA